jgi:ribonuclease-3
LGFTPRNLELYEQSLSHRSLSSVGIEGVLSNNERLEYLGDAILSAVAADFLYKKYPYADEGFLTNLRSKLVSRDHLNKLCRKIGLDNYIRMNNVHSSLPRSITGDAFEAFVGAMYLDKGYRFTYKVIIKHIIGIYVDMDKLEKEDTNYKGKLLNWAQKKRRDLQYKVEIIPKEKRRQKQYLVRLFIDDVFVSEGCDYSIKAAEQHAAMYACEEMEL